MTFSLVIVQEMAGAHGRRHRQGVRGAHPREVRRPAHALRDARCCSRATPPRASPSSRASRRRCELFGVTQVHLGADRRGRRVAARRARQLPQRREGAARALARLPRLRRRRVHGQARLGRGRCTATVVPHVRARRRRSCCSSIATVGTTIAPWMQFFVQSNIVDKGVDVKDLALPARRRDRRRGRRQHRRVVHHRHDRHRALPAGHRDHRAPSRPRRRSRRSPGSTRRVLFAIGLLARVAARGVRAAAHRRLRHHRGVRLGARHRPQLGRGAGLQRPLHLRHLLRRGASS